MKWRTIAGWVGVGLILAAYAMITLEIVYPNNILYSLINAIGALGIIASSYEKRDFQPVFLNVVWLVVAVIGITRSVIAF